jgi:serine/threonine protein kinase
MKSEEILDLFEEGRALAEDARETWLATISRRDPEAADSLRRLLRSDARERSLLDRPPPPLDEELHEEPATSNIGPYRIVREIGRGGMGRVFLAEQKGEDFTRRVAIKRLDRRESSPASERRFREEVKILAGLEHAGIARFLDGGRDAGGASYLALEYVEGLDLLAHARAKELDLAARLRLFLEVLEAVDYAHAQRIVHRDLKPGNILVGPDGQPKLLDFGISKLLEAEGEVDTRTKTELRAFTPAYASPEQLRGGKLTPASDIYSLGVVLYELLAGVRPFDSSSSSARELELAILEQEPEPPSTAARRQTARPVTGRSSGRAESKRLRLGRDLDAICLKALRKEPERRYGSVRELAADVTRYLEGRPVEAHRGGVGYRFGKRLRRHGRTIAVAGAAAVLAAVAVRLAIHLPGGAAAAPRVPVSAPPARPTLPPIGELSARFAENPNRPEIGLELARAFLDAGRGTDAIGAVTRLRQLPGELGKGPRIDLVEAEAALAVSEYQRAASVADVAREGAEKAGEPALARRARLLHARALLRLASPQESERRLDELFREAEAAGDGEVAAESLVVRAEAARRAARTEEAPRLLEAGLARARALGLRRLEVEAMNSQGRFEGEAGKIDQGLATLEASLAISKEIGWLAGEASGLLYKSALLNWKGDGPAAFQVSELAAERLRQTGNREQLLTTLANISIIRVENGEFAEAEAVIAEGETLLKVLAIPRARAQILRARGSLQDSRGDVAGSRAAYRDAIAAAREAGSQSHVAIYLSDLAWVELSAGRFEEAETAAKEAVELFESGGDARSALEVGAVVACAEAKRGEGAKARRHIEKLRRAAEESDSESARYMVVTGESKIYEALGELEKAIELRRVASRLADGFDSPALALVQRAELAKLLDRAGQHDEAVRLAREILPEADRIGMADTARDCRRILG